MTPTKDIALAVARSDININMATINFDINDALKHYMSDPTAIPTPEADGSLFDCENEPEALTAQVINPVLNPIVDSIADNPDAIMRATNMDSLQFLLKLVLSSAVLLLAAAFEFLVQLMLTFFCTN